MKSKKTTQKGKQTQDRTHISETSEMQDQTETQDQTEKQDQRETQDETETQEEREMPRTKRTQDQTETQEERETQDQRERQDETEIQFKLQIKDPSHMQGSTTEDQTNISHREDEKKQHKVKIHPTDQVQQPKTRQTYRTEKMKKNRTRSNASNRQRSTTENNRMVWDTEDRKEKNTRRSLSHGKFHNRRKEKGFPHTRCKDGAQRQVYHRQGTPTGKEQNGIRHRRSKRHSTKDEYLRGKVPQPKTTEWYRTEKMEAICLSGFRLLNLVCGMDLDLVLFLFIFSVRKQHKDEYLTGKVQILTTTEKKKDSKKTEVFLSKNITNSFLTEIKKTTDLITTVQWQKISDPQIIKKLEQLIQEPLITKVHHSPQPK